MLRHSSLFAKRHARLNCSLVNALTTFCCRYHLFASAPSAQISQRFGKATSRRAFWFAAFFISKNTASLYRLPLLFRKKAYSLFAKKAPSAQLFFAVASSQKVVSTKYFIPVYNFPIRLFYSFPCQALFAELRTNFRYNKSAYLFLK